MKNTKISEKIQKRLHGIIAEHPVVVASIALIHEAGGKALLVGGAVRDLFLELPVKDLDIEVHGLPLEKLEKILGNFGYVDTVGKAFGVLRLASLPFDWSLPRADTAGRKPDVVVDPFMEIWQAFIRRDLTMNAMGIDLVTYDFYDPFGGLQDMRDNILRAPDPVFFVEDPLRFFRVMQFAARFEMWPDDNLNALCAMMDLAGVSRERIEVEFEKLLLQAKKPSLALQWLDSIGRLRDVLPEVAALKGVIQNPDWHPEGDVFEHTKQALDAAAQMEYATKKEKLILMYAALCHDLGKALTTEVVEGKIISHGHAQIGEALAKKMLKRITANKELVAAVAKLVHYHMQPLQFVQQKSGPVAYKRLAKKLSPDVTLLMLAKLSLADKRGRNPHKGSPLTGPVEGMDVFLEKAQKARVLEAEEAPVLLGRDLLDVIKPGPELGSLLHKAYEIQIEEGIEDKNVLKERILALIKNKK